MFLAAVRHDGDDAGWMQLLIFVIVGVVYAVSALLKAKARKLEGEGEQEPAHKLAGKGFYRKGGLQRQAAKQARRGAETHYGRLHEASRKLLRVQAAVRKTPSEEKPMIEVPAMELPRGEPAKLSPAVSAPETAEEPEAGYAAEMLFDYGEPDELKKAILHYEILGKPLALRGPSEQIIGR